MDTAKNHLENARQSVADGTASEHVVGQMADIDALAADGIHFEGSVWFPYSTKLNETGQEMWRQVNRTYEAMAFGDEICEQIQHSIAQENRTEVTVKCRDLAMGTGVDQPEGGQPVPFNVILAASHGYRFSEQPLRQILDRCDAPTGVARVFFPKGKTTIPTGLRSEVFNAYTTQAPEKVEIKLRTRTWKGNAEIFAGVSGRFGICDLDKVAKLFFGAVPANCKGEIAYDGRRWKMTAVLQQHYEPVVGDVMEIRAYATGCDDGTAPIEIGLEAVQDRCVNLTRIYATRKAGKVKHFGDVEGRVQALCDNIAGTLERWSTKWGAAQTEAIADSGIDIQEIFQIICKKRLVTVEGTRWDELANRCYLAWSKEPGYTKASIINAVTRAAHENYWTTQWVNDDLAEQAGQMVHQQVFVSTRDAVEYRQLEID